MRKRFVLFTLSPLPFALSLVGALLFALCPSAEAQQPSKVPRIGYLSGTGFATGTIEGFRRGLRDLGYIEGKNILIEYRDTGVTQDRILNLVAELVQLQIDVLVGSTGPTIRAAKQATKTSLLLWLLLKIQSRPG